jgi:predicted outer membrane repeat protein
VLDQAAADAAALWIVHTHAIDAAYVSPRLAITSPEKRCGKTTLLTVLGALVARSLATANMTTATIFRVIQAARPTLLIDEADSFLSDAEEMRGVINAGHCRANATVLRTVETPQSPDGYEVRKFAVWGAMALAAIGRLPGTIEDRAIKIAMRRRRPDEAVERLRLDRLAGLTPLARRAARWVADHAVALAAADPDTPAELHDRAADNWRALLAIADAAGGGWSARARSAAVTLTREGADDGETARTMLLSDIRAAFIAKGVDRIASEDLVACLASLDDRPWPEYRAGKPITKVQLARLLKPLKISSGTIRLDDGKTPKGYYRRAFEDAFVRYLPAERNATTPQGKDSATFSQNQSATSGGGVAFPNPQNPSVSAACGVVVVREPQTGNDEDYEERAAILEYEAGMSRADAERCAYVAV